MAVFMFPVSKELWDTRIFGEHGMMFVGKGDYGAFGNAVFSPVQGVVDKIIEDQDGKSAVFILHKGAPLFSMFYKLETKSLSKFIKTGDAIDAGHQLGIIDGKILSWQVGEIGKKDSWIDIAAWMSGEKIVPLTPGAGPQQVGPDKKTDWTWPILIAGALYLWSESK